VGICAGLNFIIQIESMKIKFKEIQDNEWVRPIRKNYYLECCDCGLIHKMDFRLTGTIKKRVIEFRARRIK